MNLETWLIKERLTNKALGEMIGVTAQRVGCWIRGDTYISVKHIWEIYEITNGEVLPHDLRPEYFPQDKLKKIYGCPACQDKSPNDYRSWFHLLEEACMHRLNTRLKRRKRVSRKKTRETKEEIEKEKNV
ncbi:MAG: helix-turn-helix domain-containing protein [Neisseriaceae bacterium]|nr:helix-turn-helix domain-containing protein [Neisseriaceae bacterium]MBR0129258.1 helix-turn-helix domain-containing protein [Neisseriaceae bacterium]